MFKEIMGLPWLRTCLPMQGTQVRSMKFLHAVRQLAPCAATTEPMCLEPMLCNKKSHHNEKPMHRNYGVAPAFCN